MRIVRIQTVKDKRQIFGSFQRLQKIFKSFGMVNGLGLKSPLRNKNYSQKNRPQKLKVFEWFHQVLSLTFAYKNALRKAILQNDCCNHKKLSLMEFILFGF